MWGLARWLSLAGMHLTLKPEDLSVFPRITVEGENQLQNVVPDFQIQMFNVYLRSCTQITLMIKNKNKSSHIIVLTYSWKGGT